MSPGSRCLLAGLAFLLPVWAGAAEPSWRARTQALEQQGDYEAAAGLLREWIDRHPGDGDAYLRLGRLQHRLGRIERALEVWKEALEHAEPQALLYRRVAELCRQVGFYDAGVEVLLEGRRVLGREDLFSWELALLQLRRGDYEAAVDASLLYLRQEPEHIARVEGRLAGLAADSSRAAGLIAALSEARRSAADSLQAARLLVFFSLEAGRPEPGYEVLLELRHTPDFPWLLFQFASRCESRGYHSLAGRAYALLAQHNLDSPYHYRTLLRQAQIQERQQQYARAAATYGTLASQAAGQAESWEALFYLGRLELEKLGDAQGARATLERLVHEQPRSRWNREALSLLSECALRQDDLAMAADYLKQLRHYDPGDTYLARYRLAELRFLAGRFEEAAQLSQALLEENPRHALANDALALLMLIEKYRSSPQALRIFARARLRERQQRPLDAAPHWDWLEEHAPEPLRQLSLVERARRREEKGDAEAASHLYQILLAQFPAGDYALEAHLGRARLLEAAGRLEEALKTYEGALLHFPGDVRDPEIRLHIQRLRSRRAPRRQG